jgi:tetratricopeptide (TPR) repeat protein
MDEDGSLLISHVMSVPMFAAYILSALATVGLSPQSGDRGLVLAVVPPTDQPEQALLQPELKPIDAIAQPAGFTVPLAAVRAQTSRVIELLDIQGHRTETMIQALAAKGIVRGFPDNHFRPDDPITAKDFLTLIQKATQQQGGGFVLRYLNQTLSDSQSVPHLAALSSLMAVLDSPTTNLAESLPLPSPVVPKQAGPSARHLRSLSRADAAALIYRALLTVPPAPPPASAAHPSSSSAISPLPTPHSRSADAHGGSPLPTNSSVTPPATDTTASTSEVLTEQPDHSLLLLNQCQAYAAAGQQEKAIAVCNKALQVNQNRGDRSTALAWYSMGSALKQLGRNQEALAALDQAIAEKGAYSLAWTDKCRILSELGKQEEALAACDKALSFDSDWGGKTAALAWYNRALILTRTRQYPQAIAAYDQVLTLHPKDANTWTKQGVLLSQLGKPVEALSAHEQALKIVPTYSLALVNRAALLNQLGRYEEALTTSEQAINGNGQWGDASLAFAWDQRGQALAGLNRLDEALAAANRAVALAPQSVEAWNNRSVVLWRMENYPEALAAAERVIGLNPSYAQGWFNYGRILRSLGRNDQALAAYDQARLHYDRRSEPVALSDIWANRSAVLWRLQRYQEALESADQAIATNPNNVQAWYNRGVVLLALKQPQAALKAYRKAVQLDPKADYAWTGQGIALEQLGQLKEAIAAFEAALKLNPAQPLALQNRQTLLLQLTSHPSPVPKATNQES